ncbi:MAG: STAS domain-containing protein [Terriglobales bacterium]
MAKIAAWPKIDEKHVVQTLQDAKNELDSAGTEVALDFSSVHRIDAIALRALEEFAGIAESKGVKVVLRGVNVNVYKVLKLMKLASRFSFVS